MPRVDYDEIADVYDRDSYRARDFDPNLKAFLGERETESPVVLDIGCGTGQQLAANRLALPGASFVGIDRSAGMLGRARARGQGVGFVQGDAAVLPFAADTFDYVSSQYSYHHVGRTAELIREVHRVLRAGGRFVIVNMDPWSMDDWVCYRYFPTTRDVDHRDFLPGERLAGLFEGAGLVDVRVQREHSRSTRTTKEMLLWSRLRNTTSQLMAISDEDFAKGLARVERDYEADPDGVLETENCRLILHGDKPNFKTA